MPVLYVGHDAHSQRLLMLGELGLTLEKAMGTPLWRFLVTRAEQEAAKAVDRFLETDPSEAVKIAAAQNDIRRHRELMSWMKAAIEAGKEAGAEVDELLNRQDES